MKKGLFMTALTALSAATSTAVQGAAPDSTLVNRPNILLFLVDDMGWQDTSEPFWKDTTRLNRTYHTPNMERLADQGMKFTAAYASPVSSPSRVSLLTGMTPAAHRVTNWTLRKNQEPDPKSDILEWPAWHVNGISATAGVENTTHVTPLPQILKDNGYRTIMVGKAHFGAIDTPGADPLTLGFDINVAGHAAGGLASYLGERNFGNVEGAAQQSPFAVPGLEKYWGDDIFVTEALTIEAKAQIDSAVVSQRPFFLYMSHYAVHVPLDRDMRYYQKYKDRGLDDAQAAYCALIEGMDKSLGDLMTHLHERGVADNTVIIFISDNGGLSVTERGGRPGTQNFPLRSGKGAPTEGGVRVPMIVSRPGMTDSSSICSTPVAIHDLMPTVLDLAGVSKYKTIQRVEGSSLTQLLMGYSPSSKYLSRPIVHHFPNLWDATGDCIGTFSSIRRGDWKLIYYYATGKTMLFNLSDDIFEKIDFGESPSTAALRVKMAKQLTRELRHADAQVPRLRATGEWCPYPDGSEYKLPRCDKRAAKQ